MVLNAKKKEATSITIRLDDTAPIEPTNLMKLLGIIIDDKLNFTEHVKSIAVKATCRSYNAPKKSHPRESQT